VLGKDYPAEVCSAARALEIVGERWTLLIVRNSLFAGSKRFGDFQSKLGLATNVLTTRLETLVEAGLMSRQGDEYDLTESGRDLVPALLALTEWGDRWRAPAGKPIIYRHAGCGGDVTLQLQCSHGHPVTDPALVLATPGPAMPPERVARMLHS
jgi:DNA-binding HxlR family transcriptional regulator